MAGQKKFVNMVIHDFRSPAESIQMGLKQQSNLVNSNVQKVLSKANKKISNIIELSKNINASLQPNSRMIEQ